MTTSPRGGGPRPPDHDLPCAPIAKNQAAFPAGPKNSGNPASTLLAAALAHAKANRRVFPCTPQKRPLTRHGFKNATLDPGCVFRRKLDTDST